MVHKSKQESRVKFAPWFSYLMSALIIPFNRNTAALYYKVRTSVFWFSLIFRPVSLYQNNVLSLVTRIALGTVTARFPHRTGRRLVSGTRCLVRRHMLIGVCDTSQVLSPSPERLAYILVAHSSMRVRVSVAIELLLVYARCEHQRKNSKNERYVV